MDLKEFNQKLAMFIKDAKQLERVDPRKARQMWLKICEFALEFSKKSDIDRNFRLRLWKQIDSIINKIKTSSTPSYTPHQNISTSKPKKNIPFASSKSDEDFEININDLPEVPKFGTEDSKEPVNKEKSDDESLKKGNSAKDENLEEKKDNDNPQSGESFFDRVHRMENELKKMPEFFKEVKPEPYNVDKSIIKSSKDESAPSSQIQPEIKIEKSDNKLFDDNPINTDNDTIDPYRGTKDVDVIKDPLGSTGQSGEEIRTDKTHCYACGSEILAGKKRCPNCGAEL